MSEILPGQTQAFEMAVYCAWCKKFMIKKWAFKPGLISHGICEDCKKDVLEEFERTNKTMEVINKC